MLAPTLRRGDVVVLDNLPAHKVAGIREAITRCRAQLFCPPPPPAFQRCCASPEPCGQAPPYSPDLNPIEMTFAKLKALPRQEPARTIDAPVDRVGLLLDRFLPAECTKFFAAGYQRST